MHLLTSHEDAERLCGNKISDTMARCGAASGSQLAISTRSLNEAIEAYDKVIGLDLDGVALERVATSDPMNDSRSTRR